MERHGDHIILDEAEMAISNLPAKLLLDGTIIDRIIRVERLSGACALWADQLRVSPIYAERDLRMAAELVQRARQLEILQASLTEAAVAHQVSQLDGDSYPPGL